MKGNKNKKALAKGPLEFSEDTLDFGALAPMADKDKDSALDEMTGHAQRPIIILDEPMDIALKPDNVKLLDTSMERDPRLRRNQKDENRNVTLTLGSPMQKHMSQWPRNLFGETGEYSRKGFWTGGPCRPKRCAVRTVSEK